MYRHIVVISTFAVCVIQLYRLFDILIHRVFTEQRTMAVLLAITNIPPRESREHGDYCYWSNGFHVCRRRRILYIK